MYQQPWGQGQPQQQAAGVQQAVGGQPWAQQAQGQPQHGGYVVQGQQQAAGAQPWGAAPAAADPAASAAGVQSAAQIAAYQQYYQQQATAAAAGQPAAQAHPAASAYYGAGAGAAQAAPQAAAPAGVRTWTGTVTQIIPPNYGVIDGDAYYINAVAVGEIPKVGDRVVAEGVPNQEGAYKWRVTRLQLESAAVAAAAAAAAQAAAAAMQHRAGSALGGATAASRFSSQPGGREEARRKLQEESAAQKYNTMAPPVAAYRSEVAIAAVESTIAGAQGSAAGSAGVPGLAEKRALMARTAAGMDEEARRKAEQTVQQLGMDASNPGAKLLARMGFGTAGTGLGRNQQGISAPIEVANLKQGTGLGFDHEKAEEEERAAREARLAARDRDRRHERRRSRSRSRSPSRRYACAPPKAPTFEGDRAVATLSKRYKDLYLPSEFVMVRPTWHQSCPEVNPFTIDRPISFEFKDADKSSSAAKEAAASPGAAAGAGLSEEEVAEGRCWSARVVLVSGVNPANLYAGEKDTKLWHNPAKKISFALVKHDKREFGMVGGAWDPQDGGHPAKDPTALSRTATRHFKAATGADLSGCTQWVPFCEYVYHRPEGGGEPARTERSVVFLVDAWTVATHNTEADTQLQKARSATSDEERAKQELAEAEARLKEAEAAVKEAGEKLAASKGKDDAAPSSEGLDPPNMNVQQLQEELTRRGLDTKWNPLKGKKELVDRLQEWVTEYRTKRAAEDADFRASEEAKAALEAQKEKVREKDKQYREARAASRTAEKLLLDPPPTDKIVLHAAGEAADKKGRSLLTSQTLDALLDYDDEDNREHGFEVAVFAEQFQEMLQQRFGRAILRGLGALEAAGKLRRTSSRKDKDGKEKEDGKAGPGSASKKREREVSTEPSPSTTAVEAKAGEDEEMAEAEGSDAKRQKTEAADADGGAAPAGHVENLLTACRFFDREATGHIADEDLEEIAYMVSDNMSRKAIQGLVDGVTKRSKFSYGEHAGLVIPPASPPAPAASGSGGTADGGSGGAVVSDTGVVVIHGIAVNVPVLQQRLAAVDAQRRAAEEAQQAAEKDKADALADKQKAQQLHEAAVLELAQTREQLQQLSSTRSQSDLDAIKARVALQAAELSLQELQKQLGEAATALAGKEVKEEQQQA